MVTDHYKQEKEEKNTILLSGSDWLWILRMNSTVKRTLQKIKNPPCKIYGTTKLVSITRLTLCMFWIRFQQIKARCLTVLQHHDYERTIIECVTSYLGDITGAGQKASVKNFLFIFCIIQIMGYGFITMGNFWRTLGLQTLLSPHILTMNLL